MLLMLATQGVTRGGPVSIDWVLVGDPGNAPDTEVMYDGTTGYGSVDNVFRIGKYEVTNGQYRTFLNAVAADDPNGLYNPSMSQTYGGIERHGSPGSYTYLPRNGDANWENRPVNFVSFYDILRFVNWLQNGQPTGPQSSITTEDGAYDMSLGANVVRKPEAHFFLPNENEWYKAAYYKAGSSNAGYWNYATQSDTAPNNNPPNADTGNSANYGTNVIGIPYFATMVGAYQLSPGAYGTFDQNGNRWERNESLIKNGNRGNRGGSFNDPVDDLHAHYRPYWVDPTSEVYSVGFRIAGTGLPDITWSGMGQDNKWSTPENWGGEAPTEGQELKIGAAVGQTTAFNDYVPGTRFNGITFLGGTEGANATYYLTGNSVKMRGIVSNSSDYDQIIQLFLELMPGGGEFYIQRNTLSIIGNITGARSLTKTGNGTLILSGNNSPSAMFITDGTLELTATGQISTTTPITNNAMFQINGGVHTLGAIYGTGTLDILAAADVTASSLMQGTLTIADGAMVTITPITASSSVAVAEPGALLLIVSWFASLVGWVRPKKAA